MKIGLRVAYLGTNYHGFQRQPHQKTVEEQLTLVLRQLEYLAKSDHLQYSGRTDRGVSAVDQLICFQLDDPQGIESINLHALNDALPRDILIWGKEAVDDEFDPRRHACYRQYSYLLPPADYDKHLLVEACFLLEGTHDFYNFCKQRYPDQNMTRTIDEIEVDMSRKDRTIVVWKARSFLWQQVRRMTTFIRLYAEEKLTVDDIEQLFRPKRHKLPPSDPYPLTLVRVKYPSEQMIERDCRFLEIFLTRLKKKKDMKRSHMRIYSSYSTSLVNRIK